MRLFKKIEDFLLSWLFILGISVNLIGIFLRVATDLPQHWTTEGYILLIQTAIFIGFGTALRDNQHVTIDLLYDKVSPLWQRRIDTFSNVIGIIFSLFFFISGLRITLQTFEQGVRTPDIGIPVWMTNIILPTAGVLLLIHFIEKTYKLFSSNKKQGVDK